MEEDKSELEELYIDDDDEEVRPQKLKQLHINLHKVFVLDLDTNGDDSVIVDCILLLSIYLYLSITQFLFIK